VASKVQPQTASLVLPSLVANGYVWVEHLVIADNAHPGSPISIGDKSSKQPDLSGAPRMRLCQAHAPRLRLMKATL
jgi:hypothetical protein